MVCFFWMMRVRMGSVPQYFVGRVRLENCIGGVVCRITMVRYTAHHLLFAVDTPVQRVMIGCESFEFADEARSGPADVEAVGRCETKKCFRDVQLTTG